MVEIHRALEEQLASKVFIFTVIFITRTRAFRSQQLLKNSSQGVKRHAGEKWSVCSYLHNREKPQDV
jgi:hypothetical protein